MEKSTKVMTVIAGVIVGLVILFGVMSGFSGPSSNEGSSYSAPSAGKPF